MNTYRLGVSLLVLSIVVLFDRVTDSSVSCITSPSPSRIRRLANGSTGVIITFDGFTPAGPEDSFVYTPDPTITAIEPDIIFWG